MPKISQHLEKNVKKKHRYFSAALSDAVVAADRAAMNRRDALSNREIAQLNAESASFADSAGAVIGQALTKEANELFILENE